MDEMNTNNEAARYTARKTPRFRYQAVVNCVKYLNGNEEIEFEPPVELSLLNISSGGLGVYSENKYDDGAMLILNINLEEEYYERLSAKIIWQAPMEKGYRYGLAIFNLSGRLYTHLSKLDNSVNAQV